MSEPTIYKPSIYNGPTVYNNGGGGGGGGEIVPDGYKVCLFAYKFNSVNGGIRNYNGDTICILPKNGKIQISFTIPPFNSGTVYPLNFIYIYYSDMFSIYEGNAKFYVSSDWGSCQKDINNSIETSYDLIIDKDGTIYLNGLVGIIHRASDLQINTFFEGIGGNDWIGTKIYNVKVFDNEDKLIHLYKFGKDTSENMYIIDTINGDVSRFNNTSETGWHLGPEE